MTPREKARERYRRWYAIHRTECLARRRAQARRDRDHINATKRARYAINLDAERARQRTPAHRRAVSTWLLKNPERYREMFKDWHRRHPNAHRLASHRYRARKRGADGTPSTADIQALLNTHQDRCGYCRHRLATEIDHMVPLSRGGSNGIENLMPACLPCNRRKGQKTPDEWRLATTLERS